MKNTYNAEGKRVSKALNTGSPTRYFYEGNKAVFEYANGGTVTAFNVIGANLISRKIGTNKVYYSYNGHGDVTALLDAATKNKRAQYAYDAFGNVTDEKYYDSNGNITTNPANTIKSPIRYGEYQYDSETEYTDAQGNFVTGLYYLNARHYDPGTARFLEVDTYSGNIADPLSLNLYSYCRNEPIMYTDPTGHYTQGNLLSYEPGQQQNYDPDAWELQQDLIKLGYMNREDIPSGQEGYYGPRTVSAVNAFKNTYLPGGNTGNNAGKVGDTTWLYIKREVKLKNLEGIGKNEYYARETATIWDNFYSSYDKLIAKPKSSSSTSGNTFDYGKSIPSNQATGNVNDTLFKNIEALGSLANKYTNNKSLTNLLVFMYIRQFNSSYIGSTWDQIGGKIDVEFVDYVKNSNPELAEYFASGSDGKSLFVIDPDTGGNIEITHLAATMTGLLYATSMKDGSGLEGKAKTTLMREHHLDNLSGWAGDLQTFVRYIKKVTNDSDDYSTVYSMASKRLGTPNTTFDMSDMLADVDAVNIRKLLGGSLSIGDVFIDYYKSGYKTRYSSFVKSIVGKNASKKGLNGWVDDYTSDKYLGAIKWPLYKGDPDKDIPEITVIKNQGNAIRDAFTDFIWSRVESEK